MKDCPMAREVLKYGGLNNKFLVGNYSRCIDWIEDVGVVKINFDASVHGKKVCYGLVARDSDGFVHGGWMGVVDKEMQIEWVEMQAMEESIKVA
ncbi:hypothetical protein PVK06_030267 [Gossypium arboreum]|uniref:Uncharacterized protein n=1 Tax=Gossypium arboreum TaxID=29729 RepID=A0ABR0NMU1_GOSAR|nr:hypothetical protein PVK06_030267 [Gossypium arboreum]